MIKRAAQAQLMPIVERPPRRVVQCLSATFSTMFLRLIRALTDNAITTIDEDAFQPVKATLESL